MANSTSACETALAIDRIVELANKGSEIRQIDGFYYYLGSDGAWNQVPFPDTPHEDCTCLTSLESFCNLVANNPQNMDLDRAIITIDENFEVRLLSGFRGPELRRFVLAAVTMPRVRGFAFNQFSSQESFVISLMSQFIKNTGDWSEVFQISKKLCMENDAEITDDGMGQKVQLRKGVSAASLQSGVVKTDYVLAPYRIYTECSQPESIFFLRIRTDPEGTGVQLGLFETDGGAWRVEAKHCIASYIGSRVGIPVFF